MSTAANAAHTEIKRASQSALPRLDRWAGCLSSVSAQSSMWSAPSGRKRSSRWLVMAVSESRLACALTVARSPEPPEQRQAGAQTAAATAAPSHRYGQSRCAPLLPQAAATRTLAARPSVMILASSGPSAGCRASLTLVILTGRVGPHGAHLAIQITE